MPPGSKASGVKAFHRKWHLNHQNSCFNLIALLLCMCDRRIHLTSRSFNYLGYSCNDAVLSLNNNYLSSQAIMANFAGSRPRVPGFKSLLWHSLARVSVSPSVRGDSDSICLWGWFGVLMQVSNQTYNVKMLVLREGIGALSSNTFTRQKNWDFYLNYRHASTFPLYKCLFFWSRKQKA